MGGARRSSRQHPRRQDRRARPPGRGARPGGVGRLGCAARDARPRPPGRGRAGGGGLGSAWWRPRCWVGRRRSTRPAPRPSTWARPSRVPTSRGGGGWPWSPRSWPSGRPSSPSGGAARGPRWAAAYDAPLAAGDADDLAAMDDGEIPGRARASTRARSHGPGRPLGCGPPEPLEQVVRACPRQPRQHPGRLGGGGDRHARVRGRWDRSDVQPRQHDHFWVGVVLGVVALVVFVVMAKMGLARPRSLTASALHRPRNRRPPLACRSGCGPRWSRSAGSRWRPWRCTSATRTHPRQLGRLPALRADRPLLPGLRRPACRQRPDQRSPRRRRLEQPAPRAARPRSPSCCWAGGPTPPGAARRSRWCPRSRAGSAPA